jgi:hypothetical protein
LPFPRSKKSATTSTDDRSLSKHQEDRQYPGQAGRITGDLLFCIDHSGDPKKDKAKAPKKRGFANNLKLPLTNVKGSL